MSVATAAASPQTSTQPVLLFVHGGEQKTVSLEKTPFSIGRKTDRDLVIPDSRVSREHALIVAENGEYYVVDQGSRSGTFGGNGTSCRPTTAWISGRTTSPG